MQRALELERIARESFSPEHRRDLMAVAQDWRRLSASAARDAERASRDAERPAERRPEKPT